MSTHQLSAVVSSLVNVILELQHYDANQLPPFRADEIRLAERALASARTDLRGILAHQKVSIEKSVDALAVLDIKAAENPEQDYEPTIREERQRLRLLTASPDVALIVMLSQYQQIRRGLTIYTHLRTRRLVDIAFTLCYQQSLVIDESLATKCSDVEQRLLVEIMKILDEYNLMEKIKDLPSHPSGDRGRAWMQPPVWLLDLIKRLSKPESDPEVAQLVKSLRLYSQLEFDYRNPLPTENT